MNKIAKLLLFLCGASLVVMLLFAIQVNVENLYPGDVHLVSLELLDNSPESVSSL